MKHKPEAYGIVCHEAEKILCHRIFYSVLNIHALTLAFSLFSNFLICSFIGIENIMFFYIEGADSMVVPAGHSTCHYEVAKGMR